MTTVEYEAQLSCGCAHWYHVAHVACHPFRGARLSCPTHGDVLSMGVFGRRASEEADDE